ncbi:hypothetical protein G7046_g6787 [Stylonectria norvegica]|nr:hypothetical protein G7046_g6787 [Stylonectria norvegica]
MVERLPGAARLRVTLTGLKGSYSRLHVCDETVLGRTRKRAASSNSFPSSGPHRAGLVRHSLESLERTEAASGSKTRTHTKPIETKVEPFEGSLTELGNGAAAAANRSPQRDPSHDRHGPSDGPDGQGARLKGTEAENGNRAEPRRGLAHIGSPKPFGEFPLVANPPQRARGREQASFGESGQWAGGQQAGPPNMKTVPALPCLGPGSSGGPAGGAPTQRIWLCS